MKRSILFSFVILFGFFASGAFAQIGKKSDGPDKIASFTLEDQYEKKHTYKFPLKKPLVLSVADIGGATDGPVWSDTIRGKYGKRIEFMGVANLHFMSSLVKTPARLGIRATSKLPVLCDWDGLISAKLKAKKDAANIIVVSVSGEILHRVSGKPNEKKFAKVYEVIDSQLEDTAEEEK